MLMHWLRRLIGDRALGFSLVGRVWQTISGPITIALIIVTLSPAQQGVYYALVSIVGLQAFVELGLLNVLISYAGQESSRILPLLGRSAYLDPFVLRALGLVREQPELVADALAGFEALGLGWHAEQTRAHL